MVRGRLMNLATTSNSNEQIMDVATTASPSENHSGSLAAAIDVNCSSNDSKTSEVTSDTASCLSGTAVETIGATETTLLDSHDEHIASTSSAKHQTSNPIKFKPQSIFNKAFNLSNSRLSSKNKTSTSLSTPTPLTTPTTTTSSATSNVNTTTMNQSSNSSTLPAKLKAQSSGTNANNSNNAENVNLINQQQTPSSSSTSSGIAKGIAFIREIFGNNENSNSSSNSNVNTSPPSSTPKSNVPTLLTNLSKSNNSNDTSGNQNNDASLTTAKNLAFIDADTIDEIDPLVLNENSPINTSVSQNTKAKAANNEATLISPVRFSVEKDKEDNSSLKQLKELALDNTVVISSSENSSKNNLNDLDKETSGLTKNFKDSDSLTSTTSSNTTAHTKNTFKKHKLNFILNRTLSDSILNKKSSSSSNYKVQCYGNVNFNNNTNNNNNLTVNNSNFSSRVRIFQIFVKFKAHFDHYKIGFH